jgi:SSS family solute:Na+ symporter
LTVQVLIIAGYVLALLIIGLFARRRTPATHDGFFLAGRAVGPVLMFLTMTATNFSAFTVFGFSGAGYRIGYAYYPIMAFGTGFMALTFVLVGLPAWKAAKRYGAVTPPELIRLRFGNAPLHAAYLVVMVVFTLPYLAIQPIGAGYALKGLLGIPYTVGAVAVTAIGVGYVLLGGMKADVWTDALQGVFVLTAMLAVFIGVAAALGGFTAANRAVLNSLPELFDRPGGGNALPAGIWLSYMGLWFLCDPMFPQLFQRFLAARDERSLRLTAMLYPLATGLLFFLPVAVGVMGRMVVPGLSGSQTDQILPLVASKLLPPWLGAAAMAGGLAALMSTMDSQLLTLSSMIVRDGASLARRAPFANRYSKFAVLLLAATGLAVALRPWAPILDIATETFTGLAVLFPVTLGAIYWRGTNAWAGFASILAGESLVVLYHFRLLPAFGLLPVVPVVLVTTAVLWGGSLLWPAVGTAAFARATARGWRCVALFGLLFLAANDFWAWHRASPLAFGLPGWLWYHVGLILLLLLLMAIMFRETRRAQPAADDDDGVKDLRPGHLTEPAACLESSHDQVGSATGADRYA